VLRDPATDLAAGDQEQPVHAREGGGERLGLVVVAVAHLHAPGGEVGGLLGGADDRHDVGVGHAAPEQLLDDESTELSGGSCDGVGGHDGLLMCGRSGGATAQVASGALPRGERRGHLKYFPIN
jgi:hypothetical protein